MQSTNLNLVNKLLNEMEYHLNKDNFGERKYYKEVNGYMVRALILFPIDLPDKTVISCDIRALTHQTGGFPYPNSYFQPKDIEDLKEKVMEMEEKLKSLQKGSYILHVPA